MMIKGILPNFIFVTTLLLYFLPLIINAETETEAEAENVDFPHSRKDGETYQIYRTPQSFQIDSTDNVKAEDDITKNDSLVLFDKSKPKTLEKPEKIKSDEYIAPQRFEISQIDRNESSNRIHGIKQHDSNSANAVNEVDPNANNKYDNFGDRYQHWNESLYHQAQNNEKVDTLNPYPPLPKIKQKDPEPEYFPPSFTQTLTGNETPESVKDDEKAFSISTSLRDSTRTTVPPNTSNRNIDDITSPEMEDYDKNGVLAKGEEIQYSDDPTPSRQTYSTEGIKRDPTVPFKVTHSLMDSMRSTTPQPTTYLQDSEATIYPTLVPGIIDEEEENENEVEVEVEGKQKDEEAMITSDYISNMDPTQRDRMFSRENLQPWERHRNEVLEIEQNQKEEQQDEESNENQNDQQSTYSTYPSKNVETSTTPYLTSYLVPASSIYAAPAPPLSSYILVPSGTKYYGDQAPKVQTVSDSSYGRIYDEESDSTGNVQHKISRENIVTVEKVGDEIHGSDLSRSPQFKLYGIKTAFHKGSGTTEKNATKVEKYDTWLANPATIFDLPLPTILKTAFAVNTKAFAAKQHSDNSNLGNDEFELDESGSQLKYRKKGNGRSTEIQIAPLRELPNFQVISGGDDGAEAEIESYTDDEAIEAATKDSCQPSELTSIQSEGDEILSQCFVIAKNCLLTNAAPIERRINLNLTECATFCSENQYCKSLGYSETMSICDIFAFLNGTSDSLLLRYHGTHYLQPTRKNIKKCLQDRHLSGITVVASNDPIVVSSNKLSENQLLTLTNKANQNFKQNSCPIDTDILTLKTENYRLRNFGIDKFIQDPPNSESECIFSCLIDLANGRLPFNCTSASYNSKTNECTLYSGGTNMNGNGHLIEEKNYEHYEKVCADDKLVQQCRGFPVDRIPQKLLMGFVVSREKASSLLECITLCFERHKNHGDCLSVNYFYTEEDENCILSSESYLTIPQFFIDEIESIVDHASIDKCLKIKQDLIHVSTNNRIPEKSLAIDIEDGSRILPSTPGFDIVPTIDEKSFELNAIDGDTLLLNNNNEEDSEIRRHPLNVFKITTTTAMAPESEQRQKLTNQLKKSIKKLKV